MTGQTAAQPAATPQTPPLPEARAETLGLSRPRLQRMSDAFQREIGRASCRERVCSVV